ncbi:hypothetical protein [Emcibacter sp.]|uniref:hypothetical protein n=1 Tax=Emcibacter sp. TaxID=1979954 RepID=UPI003A8FC237
MAMTRRLFFTTAFMLALCLVGLAGQPALAQDEKLMADIDLPLFPGTMEVEDERVVFDSPEGRIIKSLATGEVSAREAWDYYRVVVPSLGWTVSEKPVPDEPCDQAAQYCLVAARDGETLVITISFDRQTVIRYSVTPE